MTVTILITGVAGLIGNNFVRWLLENIKTIKIIGIDSLEGGYKEYVCHDIDFYKFDLLDYTLVEYIFKKYKIDLIYHFAAYAAEGLSPFIRKYNYNNNLLCTTNLVNMSIKYKIKRFIFTSSMAVYGKGKAPFSEENKPNPIPLFQTKNKLKNEFIYISTLPTSSNIFKIIVLLILSKANTNNTSVI